MDGLDRDALHRLSQKLWRENIKAAPKAKEYKLLNQIKYINPPGYTPYPEITRRLTANITSMYQGGSLIHDPSAWTESIAYPTFYYQATTKAPTYWLAGPLNTSHSQPSLPLSEDYINGLVMLPNDALKTPDGEPLDFFCFLYLRDAKALPPVIYPDGYKIFPNLETDRPQLIVCTSLPSSVTYALNTDLTREVDDYAYKPNPYAATTGEPNEVKFLSSLNHLAINTLDIILNHPENVSPAPQPERIGFSAAPAYRSIYEPRWIQYLSSINNTD